MKLSQVIYLNGDKFEYDPEDTSGLIEHINNNYDITITGSNHRFGKNCCIGENCHIGGGVIIGEDTVIERDSEVDDKVILGKNVKILKGAKIETVVCINDNTVICAGATIGQHSKIGKNVTVESGVYILYSFIGEGSIIEKGATIINTDIPYNSKIGSKAMINGFVKGLPKRIGEGVIIPALLNLENLDIEDYLEVSEIIQFSPKVNLIRVQNIDTGGSFWFLSYNEWAYSVVGWRSLLKGDTLKEEEKQMISRGLEYILSRRFG